MATFRSQSSSMAHVVRKQGALLSRFLGTWSPSLPELDNRGIERIMGIRLVSHPRLPAVALRWRVATVAFLPRFRALPSARTRLHRCNGVFANRAPFLV